MLVNLEIVREPLQIRAWFYIDRTPILNVLNLQELR
ncbi:hypothetical protein OsccyDRAFT_4230 [Leptolyngbyaceae cyanobacterium JSC-12]|nr:hypothetical protein OsccyDRAFT_4230 [Leptolyngbyaceae cyanobacterium JSC-12]